MTSGSLLMCIKANEEKPLTIVGKKLLEAAKKIEAQQQKA